MGDRKRALLIVGVLASCWLYFRLRRPGRSSSDLCNSRTLLDGKGKSKPEDSAKKSNQEISSAFAEIANVSLPSNITIRKFYSVRTGLQVVWIAAPGPLVSGTFVVATETFKDDGVPHVLEHLIFMGSESYPYKGVLDELANRSLAQGTNAWTDMDHTAYTIQTAGAEGFLQILPVFLDHILFPTLTDASFTTEVHHINDAGEDAGVVYCEMQGRESSADSKLYLETIRKLFPGECSYKVETGGLLHELRQLQPQTVRDYHRLFYRPDNLCLVVAGSLGAEDHGPTRLLQAVKDFESRRILSRGFIPAGENLQQQQQRPFFQQVLHRLPQPIIQTVSYASEEEEEGLCILAFRAFGHAYILESLAMECLLGYLCNSSVAPLQKALIESEDPICSSIDFYVYEQRENVYMIEFEGVSISARESLLGLYRQTVRGLCETGIDMNLLKLKLENIRRDVEQRMEDNPSDYYTSVAISYFLYGPAPAESKQKLREHTDVWSALETLAAKPMDWWQHLLRQNLLDAPYVLTLGNPSKCYAEKCQAAEIQRLATQKELLAQNNGALGRQRTEQLRLATEENATRRLPSELVSTFRIPEVTSISALPLFSLVAYRQAVHLRRSGPLSEQHVLALCQHLKTQEAGLQSLPFALFQWDHIPSTFVTLTCVMPVNPLSWCSGQKGHIDDDKVAPKYASQDYNEEDAATAAHLAQYLPILEDVFFKSDIGGRSNTEVVTALEEETVTYSCYRSICDVAQTLAVEIKVEAKNYSKAVSWLRCLLNDMQLTTPRLMVSIRRLSKSIAGLANNASHVLGSAANALIMSSSSLRNQTNFYKQRRFLKQTLKSLKAGGHEELKVLRDIEIVRKALTRHQGLLIFCDGDLTKRTSLMQAWTENFGSHSPVLPQLSTARETRSSATSFPKSDGSSPQKHDLVGLITPSRVFQRPWEKVTARGGFVIPVAGTESAYLRAYASIKGTPLSLNHRDYAVLQVLISYLTIDEGPFFKRIRGQGFAYGYGIVVHLGNGTIALQINRASNAVAAYREAKEAVLSLATQLEKSVATSPACKSAAAAGVSTTQIDLDAAISATLYSAFTSVATMHRVAFRSLLTTLRKAALSDDVRVAQLAHSRTAETNVTSEQPAAMTSYSSSFCSDRVERITDHERFLENIQAVTELELYRVLQTYILPIFASPMESLLLITCSVAQAPKIFVDFKETFNENQVHLTASAKELFEQLNLLPKLGDSVHDEDDEDEDDEDSNYEEEDEEDENHRGQGRR